ncbi:MAG: hypothetical protein CVV27_05430 [Candidatus Melainabacteria bacterium HGW-Melainabacteria-1]|nr:MAG: hypothetical protein CVV27_05430 [Candidatus Melainabacteria bacterium HGW-Melainabacteria-1]
MPQKIMGFVGLVMSGLCMVYGVMLFWMGALRLVMPSVFAKPGQDPITQIMLVGAGVILIAIGWFVGIDSRERFNANGPRH